MMMMKGPTGDYALAVWFFSSSSYLSGVSVL